MKWQYPEKFLRGISNKDFISHGYVTPAAFQFDDQQRADNMLEASINWYDNEDAVTIILTQRKENGKIQFSAGIACVNLQRLKYNLQDITDDMFTYERAILEGNPYHGNLLISSNIGKQIRQMIQSGLALAAGTNIIAQPNTK